MHNRNKILRFATATAVAIALAATGGTTHAATKFNREFAPQQGLVAPVEKPYRGELCLNGSWQFQPVTLPSGFQRGVSPLPELAFPSENGWEKTPIRIPSPWNVNSFPDEEMRGGDFRTYPSYPDSWKGVQMGWLRRTFAVPSAWKGRRLMLHFGAVAGNTQIWVNGKMVGSHDDIFLPFDVDVTDAVRWGTSNTLLVGVRKSSLLDIQGKYGRRLYQAGSFWGQHIAGIWQDVFLEAMPVVHIDDVFVKPNVDKDSLEAQITIRNDGDQAATVNLAGDVRPWISGAGKDVLSAPEPRWSLGKSVLKTSAQSTTVPAHGTAIVNVAAKVGGKMKLWSPESPNLYGLVCALQSGGKSTDVKYTRFGWRQITFPNGKTMLNGERLKLKGDSWHFMGIPQMTRRYAWAWFRACKDANLNAARLHAQPYPAFYMDMADEMGFFILDESAIWASDGGPKLDDSRYWDNTAEHIRSLVLRDRNHPSVFGWSVSNEVMAVIKNVFHGPKEMQDELVKHFKVWYDVCRQNDPTRPWVSADGEDDGEGTLPTYIIHYGGPDGFKRALGTGKPWGVGEAGPAYYGTPREIAQQSGNPRSYLSFQDRMEGVAAISYKNLIDQHQYDASYSSVFNLAWYGLKPLALGLGDTTRPPSLVDGISFPAFVEGKPGVQPERLGPYTTTLNPGYDSRLPLYETWPLFDAIRAAQAEPPLGYKPPHPFTFDGGRPKLASNNRIASVRVLSGPKGKLESALASLGVSVVPTGGEASLLFVDGAQPPTAEAKTTIQQTLDAGGTVYVWGTDAATLGQLNALLPLPLELTRRSASSLVPTTRDALIAGLTPESLYFSERSSFTILPAGLGGAFIAQATALLSANNTDWRTWNGQGEPIKTAMVLRSEREAKPSGVALAVLSSGHGRIVVSNIPPMGQAPQATALNRTLLSNLGIILGDGGGQNNVFDANGVIKRALVIGRFGSGSVDAAVAASPVMPASGSSIAPGIVTSDRTWTALEANETGAFNLNDLPAVNPQSASSTYFSFWLNSPKDLANLLLDPHLPTLDLLVGSGVAQVWLNATPVTSKAEGQMVVASPLLLQQGWNHVLVKVVSGAGTGATFTNAKPLLQLRSSQPDYLTQLRGAQQILSTPTETASKPAVPALDAESAKALAIAAAEKAGSIVVSSERDEKGSATRKFSVQGEWNYPGVWTTPGTDKRATWEATLPATGQYRVEIWYGDDPNNDHANNALVRVLHADGEKQTRLNLQQKTRQWVDLGTFRFDQGVKAKVTLEGDAAGGNLLADLVRFSKVP